MKKLFTFLFILVLTFFIFGTNVKAQTYCTTGLYTTGCTSSDQFNSFYFGSISQASITCPGSSGYNNFTSISTTFLPGNSYTVTGTIGYASSEYCRIWIDFNNDGTFDNTTELIYANTTALAGSINANITIPITATPGPHRMRVRLVFATTTFDACTSYTYGCANDYTVNITGLTTPYIYGTPGGNNYNYVLYGNSSAPVKYVMTGANLTGGPGVITLTAPTGFQVASTINGSYGSSAILIYNGTTLNDSVYVKFVPLAANTSYTGNMTVAGGGASCNISLQGTSQLIYCTSASEYATYDNISNVTFGGINNNSGGSTYTNYYSTVNPAQLIQGVNYPLSFTISGPLYSTSTNYCQAWIDWNQDGVFDPVTELIYSGTYTTAGTILTGNIIIPLTAMTGSTRMRIIADYYYQATPCFNYATGSYYYGGETEDYAVNVLANTSPYISSTPPSNAFGYVIYGSSSPVTAFTITGNNLTGGSGSVLVTAPTGFQISLASGSGFGQTVNIPYSGGVLSSTSLYCKFVPTAANTAYSGNITFLGGGANWTVGVTGTSQLIYCASASEYSTYDNISNVTFGNINNSSGGSMYSDYTLSVSPGQLIMGVNYPLSFTIGGSLYSSGSTNYCQAWIDYNQDGIFDPVTELVYSGTYTTSGTILTSSVVIPFTAMTGPTRMRIIADYYYLSTPCWNYPTNYYYGGETEDYTVNILPNTTPYITSTPASNAFGYVPFGNSSTVTMFTISGSNLTGGSGLITVNAPTGFQISLASGSGFGSNVSIPYSGGTLSTSLYCKFTPLTANAYYSGNLTFSGGSANWTVGVTGTSALVYCASNATSTADEELLNVSIGTLNNSSTCSSVGPDPGSIQNEYSNYSISVAPPTLLANQSYLLSVQIGTCGGSYTNYAGVWIDYNQNGVFDAGEQVYTQTAAVTGPHTDTATITIPSTALPGNTRMRVIAQESTAPVACGTYTWGETEDYTVNIIPAIPCVDPANQPTALVLTPSFTTISASFSPSASADHYLIIRSASNTLSSLPVTGTTYTVGQTIGGGTVIAYQTGTTFSDANLNLGTQYYYYVFAANSYCIGGPNYLTTNPLLNSTTTNTLANGLHGVYTIDTTLSTGGTNFHSFADATQALNLNGANGAVIFNVASGTYSEQIDILSVVGANSVNNITFQSASNNYTSVILQYNASNSSSNYVVRFNGSQYVTFKAMTIQPLNTTYANSILLTNNANNINITNNLLIGTQTNTDSNQYVIRTAAGSNYSNINISSNRINYGGLGVWLVSTNASLSSNVKMNNNYFYNTTGRPAQIGNLNGFEFGNNTVYIDATKTASQGLFISGLTGQWKFHDNNMTNLGGARILEGWTCSGTGVGQEAMIYNNYMYAGSTAAAYVCDLGGGLNYVKFLYNTLVGSTTGFNLNLNNFYGTNSNLTIENNIYSGTLSLINITVAPTTYTIDYNDYYTTGANIGTFASTAYTTLASWKTITGQESHSIAVNPNFITTGDPHVSNSALIAGIAIPGINTDINGQTRASIPTIGASELPPCFSPTNQPSAFVFSASYLYVTGSFTSSPDADHYLIIRSTNSTLSSTPLNGTNYIANNPFGGGVIVSYQTGTTFTDNGLNPATQYYYFVFATNSLCSGGPLYLTLNPLSQSVNTTTPATLHSVANDVWSNPTTWSTGTVPTFMDSVYIDNGFTVHVDNITDSCYNLVVNNGGTLDASSKTGKLNIGGNVFNNGTINFYVDTANYSVIQFIGLANSNFTGLTGTTNLYQLTINKTLTGTTITPTSPTLEINLPTLTILNSNADSAGFINLSPMNGIVKFSGNNTLTNRLFSTVAYTILTTGGLWINNPNLTVVGQAGNVGMSGLLHISQGIYNIGKTSSYSMTLNVGSYFYQDGGFINSTGRILSTTAGTFVMSNGTMTVSTISNTNSLSGEFDYNTTTPVLFTMSGGTIIVQNANSNATAANRLDVRFPPITATNYNVTGGSVQLGNSLSSTTAQNFVIQGQFWNVLIDTTTAQHGIKLYAATNLLNNFTNPGNGIFYLGYSTTGMPLTVYKNFFNNGQVLGNLSTASAINFKGNLPQTFTCSNTSILGKVTINNPTNVTISPSIINYGLTLNSGILSCPSGTVTLGDGTANTFTLTKGFGNLTTSTAPLFNLTNMTSNYILNDTVVLGGTSVNNLISPVISGSLTLNNAKGLTLNKSVKVGSLIFTYGKINTLTNVLTVTNTATTSITGYSSSNFIIGNLARALPANSTNTGSWIYPIGTVSNALDTILYNPFTIINPKTGTTPYIKVSVMKGNFSGAPGTYLQTVNTDRRWSVVLDSGIFNYSRISVYDTNINSLKMIGVSPTINGTFNGINSILSTNTFTTKDSLTIIAPLYYAIGLKNPMTYVSSTTTQTNTALVPPFSSNQQIIGFQITTIGSANPLVVSQINFNANGTTSVANDISNIKLFSTGTNSTFATTTVIDSTNNFGTGSFNLNPSALTPFSLSEGTNYLWLTYDINSNAVLNDVLDAQCLSITVDGIPRVPTITNPIGNRTIFNIPYTLFFSENFDEVWTNAEDIGWTCTQTLNDRWHRDDYSGTDWTLPTSGAYSPTGALSTSHSAKFHQYYATSGTTGDLISPTINCSGSVGVDSLSFYYIDVSTGGGKIDVYLSTDNGTTWGSSLTTITTSATWTKYAISLGNVSSSQVKIKFTATSDYSVYDIGIDQISVYYQGPNVYPNMKILSTTASQPVLSNIISGLTNQQVLTLKVISQYSTNPLSVNSLILSTNGSTNALTDIDSAKVFFTGTSSTFATTNLFGSIGSPNGTFTINGTKTLTGTQSTSIIDTNYFWLVFNLKNTAVQFDSIDGEYNLINVSGTTYIPELSAPIGKRCVRSQLNGIYTIDNSLPSSSTNYIDFTSAVNDLNTFGISGSVTFKVKAGQTFPLTCTSTNNYGIKITTSGTNINPIIFQKNGTGANPILSITGSTSTSDAGVWLNSSNYITFDGIDINDAGTALEFGIYFSGTASLGCNNNTIKNTNITLSTSNTATIGINLLSTATSTNGKNSYNKFYNNTIKNALSGYKFLGTSTNLDQRNEIGNQNSGRSRVLNAGLTTSATAYAINVSYQDSLQIFNTLIDTVKSSTTGALAGIYGANKLTHFNFYGDTIRQVSGNTPYGIYLTSSSSTGANNINNCLFNQITSTAGTIYVFRPYTALDTLYFYNNDISNITQTTTSVIEGLYLSCTGLLNVFNNKIHELNCTSTTSNTNYADGIYLGSTGTFNVYNNMISNITHPYSTASPGVRAISVASTGTNRIYNNTIYLDSTNTTVAAAFCSACLYAAAATPLDLRNNIFVNKNNMASSTKYAVAFWYNSATLTSIASTTNNNLYFAGTPGAKNLIFYTTSGYQTLASYQTLMTTRDQASYTDDVPFINKTTKPFNLHINPAIATNAESHGQRITTPIAISTDFDGDKRFGETGYSGNGSYPDLGADEYNGIPISNIPPVITFTSLPNSTSLTGVYLNNVSITAPLNHINTTTFKPRLYFKKSTQASDSLHWMYTEPLSGSTTTNFNFYLDYNLLKSSTDSVVTGNTIQYFIVAQDSSTIPNVGKTAGLSGTVSSVKLLSTNLTLVTSPSSFNVLIPVNGIYNVGSGQTFTNLTTSAASGFFNYINSNVVTGNITVNITSNITNETGAVALNTYISEGVGGYTITIQPADSSLKVIAGTYAGLLIRNMGAPNVIVNGAYNGFGHFLKFINYSTTGAGIQFNTGANNCVLKNCYLRDSLNTGTSNFGVSITGGSVNNLTIDNNIFEKFYYGINEAGTSSLINTNLSITNNIFGSDSLAASIAYGGINLTGYCSGVTISNNIIKDIKNSTTTIPFGIYLQTSVKNALISNNFIRDIVYTGTSGYGGMGIRLTTGDTASNISIINNVLYNIYGDGFTASWAARDIVGINIQGTMGGVKLYNNSINMYGNTQGRNAATINAAMYISTTANNIDLRNNIIENTILNPNNTGGKSYAIYCDAPATAFSNSDYNIYYTSGSQGVLGYLGSAKSDIISWRTATTKDFHSLFTDPIYTSNTNLIPSKCPTSPAIASGSPLNVVTNDIVNLGRSQLNPTIGAYELGYAKKLNVSAMLQEYYNGPGILMDHTYDMDENTGDLFEIFQHPVVDTIQMLIMNPATMDPYNSLNTAEYRYDGLYLNEDGTITPEISLPSNMTGYRYIVLNHRNSIETWSDSVDFSCLAINYNFYKQPVSTLFPGNMLVDSTAGVYNGSLIWGGDIGDLYVPFRDGVVNIYDLSAVFDAINDPSGVLSSGYSVQDVNGDGVVNIYDLSMVFDNINAGASSVNPGTIKKKK